MTIDLDDLRRQLRSSEVEVVLDALIDIGKGGAQALADEVAGLLRHEDASVRGAAIQVLGFYWQRDGYRGVAEEMISGETDPEVRAAALMAWAAYYANSRDPRVMRRLDAILRDVGEDEFVRASAYPALLSVGALPKTQWPRDLDVFGDIAGGVAWPLVERLMQGLTPPAS